jgi:hypothetical protein
MVVDQDSSVDPSCSRVELSYAIRSARAVIEALIARDQSAAEEAALRTCHDCELLIRLIRDLALLLRDPRNRQFGFDPVATAALVRRANHLLAIVDTPRSRKQSLVESDRDRDDSATQVQNQRIASSNKTEHGAEAVSTPDACSGRTVASLGLRVRLVPIEADGETSPAAEERRDDASQLAPGDVRPGSIAR